MLQSIVAQAPLFLLIAVRFFAAIQTSPLLSSQALPRVAKVALAGCVACLVFPTLSGTSGIAAYFAESAALTTGGTGLGVNLGSFGSSGLVSGITVNSFTVEYLALLAGEALIGILMGFYLNLIFGAFSSAGQFFSLQMGFSAAEAYDALSQVENPLMGQYLNLLAMLVFIQIDGFKQLFLRGMVESFASLNAYSLVAARAGFMSFLLNGLTRLFFNAMMISLPIVGTLFLVSTSMGLMARAAPQMNLLSDSLPITLLTTFIILAVMLPDMCNLFAHLMEAAFEVLFTIFTELRL